MSSIAIKRERKRKAVFQRIADEGIKRKKEEKEHEAEQHRCDKEREDRNQRTEGPAARTRIECTTQPITTSNTQFPTILTPNSKNIFIRRGAIHIIGKIGKSVRKFMEIKRPKFGDG